MLQTTKKSENLCLTSVSSWGKQIAYVQYVDYFYTKYILYNWIGNGKLHSMEFTAYALLSTHKFNNNIIWL